MCHCSDVVEQERLTQTRLGTCHSWDIFDEYKLHDHRSMTLHYGFKLHRCWYVFFWYFFDASMASAISHSLINHCGLISIQFRSQTLA